MLYGYQLLLLHQKIAIHQEVLHETVEDLSTPALNIQFAMVEERPPAFFHKYIQDYRH